MICPVLARLTYRVYIRSQTCTCMGKFSSCLTNYILWWVPEEKEKKKKIRFHGRNKIIIFSWWDIHDFMNSSVSLLSFFIVHYSNKFNSYLYLFQQKDKQRYMYYIFVSIHISFFLVTIQIHFAHNKIISRNSEFLRKWGGGGVH